jgi:hypothetical protein
LEEAMDVIEKGTVSVRKASRHHNIPLTLLSNHLYGKTRSIKARPIVGLSISLQQLNMKVVELTQTKLTPFQGRVPWTSLWY